MRNVSLRKRFPILAHRKATRAYDLATRYVSVRRPDLPYTSLEFLALVSGVFEQMRARGAF